MPDKRTLSIFSLPLNAEMSFPKTTSPPCMEVMAAQKLQEDNMNPGHSPSALSGPEEFPCPGQVTMV